MTDEQNTFLQKLTSETLGHLIAETVSREIGISPRFFGIAVSKEFQGVQPEDFVDLCVQVIKERIVANRSKP